MIKHLITQERNVSKPVEFTSQIFVNKFLVLKYIVRQNKARDNSDFKVSNLAYFVWDKLSHFYTQFQRYLRQHQSDINNYRIEEKFMNKWLKDKKHWILNSIIAT